MPRDAVTITLPYLPPRSLSPNGRAHWAERYRDAQAMMNHVIILVLEAGKPPKPFERATLTMRWEAKDRRRRDYDNLLAATKPALDGLVQGGVLVDDNTECLSLVLEYAGGQAQDAVVMTVRKALG